MYQKIIIIGNLGRDPEMRYTPSGTPVTSFSVATSRRWTGQDGQQQERTVWFRVNAWNRLAETCNQYLSKGRQVFVEGELSEPSVYQARDGEYRASLDIRAWTVRFLGGRGGSGDFGPPPVEGTTAEPPASSGPSDAGDDNVGSLGEEEIPF